MKLAFINFIILSSVNPSMEEGRLKQSHKQEHVIDLTKIQGGGDFSCPQCGVRIAPEDDTESVYRILETKLRNKNLEEIIILCNKCRSTIHLIGFGTEISPE